MSDLENFLSRWSRRKRDVANVPDRANAPAGPTQPVEDKSTLQEAPSKHAAALSGKPDLPEPAFDPTSLPPIELITGDTDIRGFLAPGVPPELARSALRRAWAADPKIRNFVGLADYDWDFNAPGSMAGFGPLEMTEELQQIVSRIIGPAPASDERAKRDVASAAVPSGKDFNETDPPKHDLPVEQADIPIEAAQDAPANKVVDVCSNDESTAHRQENITLQNQSERLDAAKSIARRSHGRAVPK